MSEHEPFDFGVRIDGVHHESIRCRACSQAWPCLTARHVEALALLDAERARTEQIIEVAEGLAKAISNLAIHYIGKAGGIDLDEDQQDPVVHEAAAAFDAWRALGIGKGEGER